MQELIRSYPGGDALEKETPSRILETRVKIYEPSAEEVYWEEAQRRIIQALYSSLLDDDTPLSLSKDGLLDWLDEMHPKAVKRLAKVLPATRGSGTGKVGITEKSARILLDNPEKLSSEQVRAVMDATGVSLEFLRGQTLERTATATHGGTSELAAIYDALSDRGKETLWSVATALASREQNART